MDEGLKEGVDFDVIWNGTLARSGLTLLPPRDTIKPEGATREPRRYNKTGNHTQAKKDEQRVVKVRGPRRLGIPDPVQIIDVAPPELGWADRQLTSYEDAMSWEDTID